MPPFSFQSITALTKRRGSLFAASVCLLLMALLRCVEISSARHVKTSGQMRPEQLADGPRMFLWAWERREDLTYLDVSKAGVAYLAGTIRLAGDDVGARPRMQPLRVPPKATLIAVFRIESDPNLTISFSARQRAEIIQAIQIMIARHDLAAVQIDFDARKSERVGYRQLMMELRDRLPENMGLQMTVLASWCLADDWIKEMPVDEAVPMFFNMGADSRNVNERLRSGMQVQSGVCGKSVGLATYEANAAKVSGKRVFWFTSGGWTKEKVETAERYR